jgi:hypothetical protein
MSRLGNQEVASASMARGQKACFQLAQMYSPLARSLHEDKASGVTSILALKGEISHL